MDRLTIENIIFISTNKDGNFYIGYKVKPYRNLKPKNGGEEILIYGFNKKDLRKVLTELVNK